jgi:L-ascorbate metabolism protein UlaG (beta-lactamase superfamily)
MNQHSFVARIAAVALMASLSLGVFAIGAPPTAAQPSHGTVTMEWLGHMFFRFTTAEGLVVLTTPNFEDGPAPISPDQLGRADIILIPNGHSDDRGNVLEIAARTGATVVAPFALGNWLVLQGLDRAQLVPTGAGSLHTIRGVRIRTVQNVHDVTISDTDNMYGGAVGYIIMFENGFTAYFAASSDVFMDMQLYGSLYKPHVALIHSSSGRDPASVAEAARLISTNNPNLREIVPTHIRFGDPANQRVAAAVRQLGLPITVLEPAPGQIFEYGGM